MTEKEKLRKELENAIQRYKSVKRTWFLFIWLGYSFVIFFLFINILEPEINIWLFYAAVSLVLGIFMCGINQFIWSQCLKDVDNAKKYFEGCFRRLDEFERQTRK